MLQAGGGQCAAGGDDRPGGQRRPQFAQVRAYLGDGGGVAEGVEHLLLPGRAGLLQRGDLARQRPGILRVVLRGQPGESDDGELRLARQAGHGDGAHLAERRTGVGELVLVDLAQPGEPPAVCLDDVIERPRPRGPAHHGQRAGERDAPVVSGHCRDEHVDRGRGVADGPGHPRQVAGPGELGAGHLRGVDRHREVRGCGSGWTPPGTPGSG